MARLSGYGMGAAADAYLYRPSTVGEVHEVFRLAREGGRQVVLRGAGRSYGDASIAGEALALDISRMNAVLSWDPVTGVLDAEAGLTIEGIWRRTLEDGWWPPVVSGTMFPTLAGALAMNIHGKNNFRVGTLGEQVIDLDVVTSDGRLLTLTPDDPRFHAVVSGLGLLGAITRVKLQLKKVPSGDVRVVPVSARNWDEQFAAFEEFEGTADYMVSWVDCFSDGRGLFHAAYYDETANPATLRPEHQDLPDTILGFWPKSVVWRALKFFSRRAGMRFINAAKYRSSAMLGDRKEHPQSLVGFSFLLDYVPNWRWAYLPHGFIQYQSFVPKEQARRVFAEQVRLQREARLESYLGVMKRHRPDPFLFSHAVDGYSLALDFKVHPRTWPRLEALCHQMNDLVLEAGGRFYLAKDSTLRPSDLRGYIGDERLAQFRDLKAEMDPGNVLTSALAKRLEIV